MNKQLLLFASSFLACVTAAFGQAPEAEAEDERTEIEYRFSLDHEWTYNRVTGPGRGISRLNTGWHHFSTLNANMFGQWHGLDIDLMAGVKITDDRTRDPRDVSLVTLRGSVGNDYFSLALGDVFETFSQYSLSTSLKGGALEVTPFGWGGTRIAAVHGIAYPRWDSFLDDPDTAALRREISGLHVSQPLFENLMSVGVSYVYSDDSRPVFPTDPLHRNQVAALEYDWEIIEGLNLNMELAYADTSIRSRNEVNDEEETERRESSTDIAHRIELVGDGGPSRVQLEHERIGSDFWTSGGNAVSDRERYRARWRYRISRDITMTTGYLYYRNNLDGELDTTTHNHRPDLTFTWRRLFDRQFAVADLRYRQDWSTNVDRDTLNHFLTVGYRDRLGAVDIDTNLGYTIFKTKEDIRNAKEYTYSTTVSSQHEIGEFILRPQIRLGGWVGRNELESETDLTREHSAGLGVEVPACNLNMNLRAGRSRLSKDDRSGNSTRDFVSLNSYYRPKPLQNFGRTMISMNLRYNDMDFTMRERNYSEFSFTMGLNVDF